MIYAEFTDITNWAFKQPATEFELLDLGRPVAAGKHCGPR